MSEVDFTQKICRELRSCNTMVYAIVANMRSAPHWPDRYCCHKLWHGLIEFKGAETEVRLGQRIIVRELHAKQPFSAVFVREPNIIFVYDAANYAQCWNFDGSGLGLIKSLHYLRSNTNV